MTHKLPHPSIEDADPWADDILNRQAFGLMLSKLIDGIAQPFVISVKGEWGSGKSVFLKRLQAELETKAPRVPVIFVDAWKYDYYEDPLYALVAEVEKRLARHNKGKTTELRNKMFGAAATVLTPLSKIVGAAADIPTAGGASALVEGFGELGAAFLKANEEKRDAHDELRTLLQRARDQLLGISRKDMERRRPDQKVVVIIDELDRCRPDYAIKLLERVKHFFDMPGYLFVIAIDGKNLHEAVSTLYGVKVDGEKYLRKFFDLETYLPAPDTFSFNRLLRQSFDVFNGVEFSEDRWQEVRLMRIEDGGRFSSDGKKNALIETSFFFEHIAHGFGLKLRDQSQAYSKLYALVMALGGTSAFQPVGAALLVCLRYANYDMYEQWRVSETVPKGENYQHVPGFMMQVAGPAKAVWPAITTYFHLLSKADVAGITQVLNDHGNNISSSVTKSLSRNVGTWPTLLKSSYMNVFALTELLSGDDR